MEYLKLVLCSLLSIISMFITAKIMGHKQVAQLDFFDYISGITVGSIAAELATELEEPFKPLIAIIIYGGVSVILSYITQKFPKSRKFINGSPTIILNDGKIYRKNLKKAKLDLSEFMLLCRDRGFFSLADIQTAIFEHNGKLTILPKANAKPLTTEDIGIKKVEASFGTEIIMDGRIMGENLYRLGFNEKWLERQLKQQGFKSAKEILLGVYEGENSLSLFEYC